MLIMVNSISVLICNRCYARRVDSGKLTTFKGVLFFDAIVN